MYLATTGTSDFVYEKDHTLLAIEIFSVGVYV